MPSLKLLLVFVALGGLVTAGCQKEDPPEETYPLWLITVSVYERTDGPEAPPVSGCPRLVWLYGNNPDERHIEQCAGGSNSVRAQRHLGETVTVTWFVECDGYSPSEPRAVTFRPEDATVHPDRGGPEVIHAARVLLLPE